jgi:hypothetical protein
MVATSAAAAPLEAERIPPRWPLRPDQLGGFLMNGGIVQLVHSVAPPPEAVLASESGR